MSLCDLTLKVCEQVILQIACENFAKFTTKVQMGTERNRLDFAVKGQGHSKTKYGQNRKFRNFEGHSVKSHGTDNLSGEGIVVEDLLLRIVWFQIKLLSKTVNLTYKIGHQNHQVHL